MNKKPKISLLRTVSKRSSMLLLFWFCLQVSSQAQEYEIREITAFPNPVFQFNWAYNSFLDLPKDYQPSPFSMSFDAAGMYTLIGKESPVALALGVGIATHNYKSNAYVVDGDSTYFKKIPKNIKYSVNKLSLVYVDLPIEIRLRTRPKPPKRSGLKVRKRNFRSALGFKIGYNIKNYTKYDGENFNSTTKESIKHKK